jgi:hypothetical protein
LQEGEEMMSLMTYACIIGINFLAGCIFGLCVSQRSDSLIQHVFVIGYYFAGAAGFLMLVLNLFLICFGGIG